MKRSSHRCAFTLVELLVVIAILGILTALLLPAIQSVRNAANRVSCANRLHQIGIGIQSYHSAHDQYPVGGIELRLGSDKRLRQFSWNLFLLPYLELNHLYQSVNRKTAFDSEENREAAATIIPVFICPSGTRGSQLASGRGPSDYGGIFGERITKPNNPPGGTMLYDTKLSSRDVTDGTSQTIIVGEDVGFRDGQWINGRNLFDQAFQINQAPSFENDLRSDHPQGVNVSWCDGHVSFLAESMDLIPLAAVCTRSGGETVQF
ncbi:MAG: DUF1559 domain-containing protein [Planctomycetota bacterium]